MKSVSLVSLRHHAFKVAVPLSIVSTLMDDIRGRSLVFSIGSIVGYAATVILILSAWSHARHAGGCEKCVPKSPERLNLLVYRAWRVYGKWGVTPMLAFLSIALFLGAAILDPKPPNREVEFNWGALLWLCSMILAVMLHIGTVRFCRLNHPSLRVRRPVQSFIDRRKWLRHNGHLITVATAVTCASLALFTHGKIWGTVQSAVMLALIISIYANYRHSMSLCERCAVEFRTDAPDYAETRKWLFKAIHRFGMIPVVTLLITMVTDPFLSDRYDSYFLTMNLGFSAALALLNRFHSSYQPWCPYCRNDGGGGGGHGGPVPDPAGGRGKPIPVS